MRKENGKFIPVIVLKGKNETIYSNCHRPHGARIADFGAHFTRYGSLSRFAL